MTLLQIKYLVAVVESGNVSRAANELYVSRPAVSRSLRELEEEFGLPLFYRTNTGLVLTDEGRYFYEKCEQILKMSDTLDTQMRLIREKSLFPPNRTIRLGITPTTSVILFADLYKELMAKHPDIEIITLEYSTQQSRQALENGTMDIHLTADTQLNSYPPGYQLMKFFDTVLAIHVSKDHHLAEKEVVTVEDIKDEPLAYLMKYYQNENKLADLFAEAGYTPNIRFRTIQLSTIRKLVREKLGCAALMYGAIDDVRNVVAIPISPPVVFTIGLVWNQTILHSNAFDDFLSFAGQYRADCIQNGKFPIIK